MLSMVMGTPFAMPNFATPTEGWAQVTTANDMTRILTLALSATLLFATSTITATAQDGMRSFGAKITSDGAVGIEEMLKMMGDKESMDTKLECEVITSCTVKGCWMDVKMPDGSPMKVRFVDYGFFVPKQGLEGKRAIMQGTASRETFDVATLRHYAEDAGKSKEEIAKITEPKHVLTFLAEGVLITE